MTIGLGTLKHVGDKFALSKRTPRLQRVNDIRPGNNQHPHVEVFLGSACQRPSMSFKQCFPLLTDSNLYFWRIKNLVLTFFLYFLSMLTVCHDFLLPTTRSPHPAVTRCHGEAGVQGAATTASCNSRPVNSGGSCGDVRFDSIIEPVS